MRTVQKPTHNAATGDSVEPECEPELPPSPADRENDDDAPVRVELSEEPDVDDEEEELVPDLPPEKPFPTLPEYQRKWDRLLAQHSKANEGDFSRDNLVPSPVPQLFQDCPHVPFDKLVSREAQARLSRCRPVSGFEAPNVADGVATYAHCSGEVNFRRRQPLQVAATLGFVLGSRTSKFLGLKPEEIDALHECLTWGRQPGNNKFLEFFGGEELVRFDAACKKLMSKFKSMIPEGSHRARIRAFNREVRNPKEGCLGDTLGDEPDGMVIVDFDGHPMKYDQMRVFEDVIAKQTSRIEIDVPREGGAGWRRTRSFLDTQDEADLDEEWRRDIGKGARYMLEETWVKVTEPHYAATRELAYVCVLSLSYAHARLAVSY